MKTHTQVAIIGGGIAGCSTLYHLTQEGITDCVLIERAELTSGTTWHSAAQVTNFGMAQTVIGLKSHSIKLYKELADDPDYPINYHYGTGGIRLATTQDHVDGYMHYISMAKGMGVDLEFIDAEECKRRHPLISTEGLLGAVWDPKDGRDISDPEIFTDLPWLQELGTNEISDWMTRQGIAPQTPVSITHMPGNLIMEALRQGNGLAYTPRIFVDEDIKSGTLVELYCEDNVGSFYIITRPDVLRPPAKTFVNWLKKTAASEA